MRNMRHSINRLLIEILMLILSLTVLIPMFIMVLGSLKTTGEADSMSLKFPTKWMFENYIVIFEKANLIRASLNSVIVTVSATVLIIVVSSLASFIIARSRNKWARYFFNLFLLGMIIPPFLISEVFVFKMLHIQGSYLALILHYAACGAIPTAVFMYTGFIKSIPREIDESAFMDGSGTVRLFFRLILPLLQPVSVTAILIISISIWNDFIGPLWFLNRSAYFTLPLTIFSFFGQYSRDWNLVFADLILTLTPVTILFFLFQKFIISGLSTGAVKG